MLFWCRHNITVSVLLLTSVQAWRSVLLVCERTVFVCFCFWVFGLLLLFLSAWKKSVHESHCLYCFAFYTSTVMSPSSLSSLDWRWNLVVGVVLIVLITSPRLVIDHGGGVRLFGVVWPCVCTTRLCCLSVVPVLRRTCRWSHPWRCWPTDSICVALLDLAWQADNSAFTRCVPDIGIYVVELHVQGQGHMSCVVDPGALDSSWFIFPVILETHLGNNNY